LLLVEAIEVVRGESRYSTVWVSPTMVMDENWLWVSMILTQSPPFHPAFDLGVERMGKTRASMFDLAKALI
jgi:hypothetical protein